MPAIFRTALPRAAFAAFALLSAWSASPARAAEAKAGAIVVEHAWARATPPHAMAGGVFATIVNTGSQDDKLVGAQSDVAKVVELHTHVVEGEVMRMRQIPAIDLPAGKTVKLAPGGYHVMLIKLKQPLRQGDHFPLTLEFEKAGKATVEVAVEGMGAMGPMHGGQ